MKAKVDLRNPLRLLLALAAAGWGVAFYALYHRQRLFIEGLNGKSFCHVGEAFNCDAAALSDFSSTFGIPTAAYGLAFYAVVFLLAMWTYFAVQDGEEEKSSTGATLLFALTAVSLVPTAYLAFVLFAKVRTICLMCIANYAVNLSLFGVAWKARQTSRTSASFRALKPGLVPSGLWIAFAISTALHFFIPTAINSSLGSGAPDTQYANALVARHLQSPVQNIRLDDSPSMGAKDAAVTIVEFSDFQCPHCRRAAMTLPQVTASYGDRVRIVFKNFPLNSTCNPSIQGAGHALACEAAKAGRCVFKLRGDEAFFAYADEVFENQDMLTNEFITKFALNRGIAPEKLKDCLADFTTHQAVLEDTREGQALGVEGTPAIYINGRFAEGAVSPTILKPMLDSYLKK